MNRGLSGTGASDEWHGKSLNNDGFSTRSGWLTDRFGVAWQLNLA